MTQHRSPDDNARAPIDRTRTSRGGGSIGLVLLVALVLVGAAGGLLLIGRTNAEPYILALLAVLAMVGVFLAVRARGRHPAHLRAARRRARCSRPWSTAPTTASWSPTRAGA